MDLDVHVVTSLVLSTLLFPFFGWVSLLAVVGGVLVDFDHYLLYIIRTGDFSLKRGREYYTTRVFKREFPVLHVFHTVECFAVLVMLSFVHPAFAAALAGYALHMVIDFFYTISRGWWTDRSNSVISWFVRYARKSVV